MRDLAHVLAWIEQHRQRRIADRPALHLVHRIIDEEQRLAVADDEDRHALFVLEADLAGLLRLSVPVSTLPARSVWVNCAVIVSTDPRYCWPVARSPAAAAAIPVAPGMAIASGPQREAGRVRTATTGTNQTGKG